MIESIDNMLKRFQIYQYSCRSATLVDDWEMICLQFRLAHSVFPPPLYYTSHSWKLHGFQLPHALKCARRCSPLPGHDDALGIHIRVVGRIDLMIVRAEAVDDRQMIARLADHAVAARALTPLQLGQRAVYANEEYIEWRQQIHQLAHPIGELDHMIDDQII